MIGTGPNLADVFYIICLATMAAGLTYPNGFTTPINAIGCLLALMFLTRPLLTRQAMQPTRPLPLGVTPMASAMDKLATPATVYISPTAFVDIDRFLATADARQRAFNRAGVTVSQMALGSFISIAVVMVVIGIASFVVLQMQFVGERASFYPSSRLVSMADINKVSGYWPTEDASSTQQELQSISDRLDLLEAAHGGEIGGGNVFATQAVLRKIGLLKSEANIALSEQVQMSLYAGASPRTIMKTLAEAAEFPRLRRVSGKRVVMVILDGMRFDHMDRNAEFSELLQENWFRKDAKVLKMKGQLPSMSVPNWLTLVSGSPPEITGVLGNLNVKETRYDSVFSRAGLYDPILDISTLNATAASMLTTKPFQRGLTASPWFGDLLRNHLPELQGSGTVDVSYVPPQVDQNDINTGIFGNHDTITADYADWRRATIAVQAISQVENPYKLFLAHFSDIDQQGHCCGVETKYNSKNSYYDAVTNKTIIIRAILDAVRTHPLANDTVVVITSDHGHLAPGGHGGVSDVLTDLPLIFYSPNSGLSFTTGAMPDGSRFPVKDHDALVDNPYERQTQEIKSTYVAPTITALLGIPAPRQAVGLLVNDALPLLNSSSVTTVAQDHFEQKKQLLMAFMAQSGARSHHWIYDDPVLADDYNMLKTTQGYVDGATRIAELYADRRDEAFSSSLLRNFFIALVTVLCISFVGIVSIEARSLVYLHSLAVYRYAVCCCLFKKQEEEEENARTRRYSTIPTGQLAKAEASAAQLSSLGVARTVAKKHDYSGAASKRRAAGTDISEFQYRQAAGLLESRPITGERNVNDRSFTGQDISRRRHSMSLAATGTPGGNGTRSRAGSFSAQRPSMSYGVIPNRSNVGVTLGSGNVPDTPGGGLNRGGSIMMTPLGASNGLQHSSSQYAGRGPLAPPQPPPQPGMQPSASFDYRRADLAQYGQRSGPGALSNAGETHVLGSEMYANNNGSAVQGGGSSTVLGVRTIRKKKKKPLPQSVQGDGVTPPQWAAQMPIKPHAAVSAKEATAVEVQVVDDEDHEANLNLEIPEPEPEPEKSEESSDDEQQGLAMPTQISTYDPAARDWKRYHDELKELALLNRRAIIVALSFIVVYMFLSLIIFTAAYSALGYEIIDSSVLHTDLVLPRYLFLCVLVPCIVQFVLTRALYAKYVVYVAAPAEPAKTRKEQLTGLAARLWSNLGRLLCTEITSRRGLVQPAARGFLYLTLVYLLMLLVFVLLVLMIAQACFEFWIPNIYPVYFINSDFWVTRFRVLAFELIMMPFIIFCTLLLLCLPDFHPYLNHYDSILRLFIYKERAMMLRQDPVPLNLDAALEVIDRELDLMEDLTMTSVTCAREAAKINAPIET